MYASWHSTGAPIRRGVRTWVVRELLRPGRKRVRTPSWRRLHAEREALGMKPLEPPVQREGERAGEHEDVRERRRALRSVRQQRSVHAEHHGEHAQALDCLDGLSTPRREFVVGPKRQRRRRVRDSSRTLITEATQPASQKRKPKILFTSSSAPPPRLRAARLRQRPPCCIRR